MISLFPFHKKQSKSRDLLAEMSAIIRANDIKMRMLHVHDIQVETKTAITQNQHENPPKSPKRQYKKSPLGQDNHMPIIKEEEEGEKEEAIDTVDLDEKAIKFRKYKKDNDVAYHCQKLIRVTAYPSVAQITFVIHQISQSSAAEIDEIKRMVLLWFRKRREYLATKIYTVCDGIMEEVWASVQAESSGLSYESTVNAIILDKLLMERVLKAAKLKVKDKENGLEFVRRKVKDYFMKLCSKT